MPFKKGQPSKFKGKHHSKETKEKLRQLRLGKPSWNKGLSKKKNPDKIKYGLLGFENPRWNGGCRRTLQNYAFGVWEKHNGPFPNDMVLHHIDGNPANNLIENLACITWGEHERIHVRNPHRDHLTGRFTEGDS